MNGKLVIRDFCEQRLRWEKTHPFSLCQLARVPHETSDQQQSAFNQILDRQTLPIRICTGDNRSRSPLLAKILDSLFSEKVATNLPYIEIEMPCAISGNDRVMLSEDSVVIVKVRLHVLFLQIADLQCFLTEWGHRSN
jgi:hypothetical protein